MGYPIYHSQYTAAQIEAAIGKGPRVNSSGYWEVWNVGTMAYESTEVGAGVTPPTVVTQVSQMTNHGYVYIYNGSEPGYTPGYWYYWNGSAWTAGGAYQVAATDPTLSVAGAAADAKAVGDELGELKEDLKNRALYDDYANTVLGLVIPYNIFDKSHVEDGYTNGWKDKYVIDADTGEVRTTTSDVATTYMIPVLNKRKVVIKFGSGQIRMNVMRMATYDYDGNVVGISDNNISSYIIPAGAYYIRISVIYSSVLDLSNNITVCDDETTGTPYQSYVAPYSSVKKDADGVNNRVERLTTYNDYANDVLGLVIPYNIFDKDHAEEGCVNGWKDKYVINTETGEIRSTTSYIAVSYMFPLYNKQKVCLKFGSGQILTGSRYVAFYDVNKEYISYTHIAGGIADVPANAYYARIEYSYGSGHSSNLSNHITVCDDNTAGTPYQNYFAPYSKEGRDTYKTPNLMQIFPKFTGIGDSLMGGFMNRDGVSITTATAREAGNNWFNYLMIRLGRAGTNLAVGGSTAKQWREELLSSANIDTDCYIIGIGVNDKRQELAIGSLSDIATSFANNADSFYGNYDYMLRQLMAWNSNAHIFCFTIPEIEGGNSADYNTAIKAITALYSEKVHCIDLRNEFYADLLSDAMVTTNYTGGHFNPISYTYMSTVIQTAIDNFMYDNQGLFATAPYA